MDQKPNNTPDWSTQIKKNQNLEGNNLISQEELKIRGEIEIDIERNLEEEIKDGIYHLALKLHRLYQNQKERKKTLSEVNISIRMDGGTKIEIKEIKKEAPVNDDDRKSYRQWSSSSRSENVNSIMAGSNNNNLKKFDWTKSLRSSSGSGFGSVSINNGRRTNKAMGWKC